MMKNFSDFSLISVARKSDVLGKSGKSGKSGKYQKSISDKSTLKTKTPKHIARRMRQDRRADRDDEKFDIINPPSHINYMFEIIYGKGFFAEYIPEQVSTCLGCTAEFEEFGDSSARAVFEKVHGRIVFPSKVGDKIEIPETATLCNWCSRNMSSCPMCALDSWGKLYAAVFQMRFGLFPEMSDPTNLPTPFSLCSGCRYYCWELGYYSDYDYL